ncbi:hypothetical protein V2G26_021016 [Clonostachys chloroleuca]
MRNSFHASKEQSVKFSLSWFSSRSLGRFRGRNHECSQLPHERIPLQVVSALFAFHISSPHCSAWPDDGEGRRIEDLHPVLYSNYRATVTLSMVAVKRAIDTGIEASFSALSVGQIISTVIALATTVRVLWLGSRAIYINAKIWTASADPRD